MRISLTVVLLIYYFSTNAQFQYISERSNGNEQKKVSISLKLPISENGHKNIEVSFSSVESIRISNFDSVKSISEGRFLKFLIKSDEPVFLMTSYSLFKGRTRFWLLAEPGDDILITSDRKSLKFSGLGSEKYKLKYKLDSMLESLSRPTKFEHYSTLIHGNHTTVSIDDYLEWNKYLAKRIKCIDSITNSYKNSISDFAYTFIKASFIERFIDAHTSKFSGLVYLMNYKKEAGVSPQNLCDIYDSIYYPATNKLYKWVSQYVYGSYRPIAFEVHRKYFFDGTRYPLTSVLKRRLLYYELASQTFKGVAWDQFVTDFLVELATETGFTAETEKLLASYYSEPTYPEYKVYVKRLEKKARERSKKVMASDFRLIDSNGVYFTKENIKGKVAVLDFWFTGCLGCTKMAPALRAVEEKFKNDTNIVFINISVDADKERWLKSIKEKKFTSGHGINLYTEGKSTDHPIIEDYGIDGYPKIFIIDHLGMKTSYEDDQLDPRGDGGDKLGKLLRKELAYAKDGPYVLYKEDTVSVCSIQGYSIFKENYNSSGIPLLRAQTDQNTTFPIVIKRNLSTEEAEMPMPSKLLALSDIEGNFEALRKLLQGNKIIDENYNWIFGNGHLVFIGDMFDRGNQVTECLWLIYSLEEKAKLAGGYVHFILGNHEIMNLQGDHRYAKKKYENNAALLERGISGLYGEDTELGKWLRTKNVIEKIGNLLFLHGGISNHMNDLSITIKEINHLVRSHCNSSAVDNNDGKLDIIMSTSEGPFWYRGYYRNNNSLTEEKLVDKSLNKFNVKHIITGHTITRDTINVHYNNKVINTDTEHSEGKSEALLIENGTYYRVNQEGRKIFLFNEVENTIIKNVR